MANTNKLLKSFSRGVAIDGDPLPEPVVRQQGRGGAMKAATTKPTGKAEKVKPIPVRIVNEPIDVETKPEKSKPCMSFEVSPTMDLPKLGETVRVSVTGTVVSAETFKRKWDGNKPKARVEIEYTGPGAVTVKAAEKTVDEIDDSDDAMGM